VLKTLLVVALLALSPLAHATVAPSTVDDPVLEKRVTKIAEELRCLVCQNQTIADSHAELAIDLKNQVRDMLRQGKSESEIKDYMVQRYGDFVLYRPPVKGTTWLLWLGPFALLLGGLIVLIVKLRQRARRVATAEAGMSEEQHRKAAAMLGEAASPRENS
jgi:cytochrome c-type biogenesis protein CcmH